MVKKKYYNDINTETMKNGKENNSFILIIVKFILIIIIIILTIWSDQIAHALFSFTSTQV